MYEHTMSIGRFRDVPAEMDDVEREVAAAQYPEGGLVLGLGGGVLLGMVTVDTLLIVLPLVGAVVGFAAGRGFRTYRLQQRRTSQDTAE